jgi:ketosteroid isomerase-like protein
LLLARAAAAEPAAALEPLARGMAHTVRLAPACGKGGKMSSIRAEIESANERFMAAVRTRDEAGFVALYSPDAVLLLPGREPLQGHAGARMFFSSFEARGVREIKLTTLEVEGLGETAWERGASQALGADGTVKGTGKYIVIWKRGASGWQLHRDILNASS